MDKSKSKIIFINILNYLEEERLLILKLKAKILTFATKKVNITIISADVYRFACKLKKVQVFAIFITDLKYLAAKKTRQETNLKSVVLEEYFNLF